MASLKFLTPNVHRTVSRFPASVFCSLCLFALSLVQLVDPESLSHLAHIFIYGFFSFGIARLAAEAHHWSWIKEMCVGAVLTLGTFFAMVHYGGGAMHLVMAILFISGVLAIPFLLRKSDDLSFWYFQQQFAIGFLYAFLSALLLAAGILIALFAAENLFQIKIPDALNMYVWCFAAFVYAPFNALSWMPEKFDVEEAECHTAPGLPFLLNWILAPLALLYFIILYAYGLKILIDWELPRGQIVNMVTGFGALGIVFYVSGWTMRETGSAPVRFLYNHFFKLLILPVVLLGVAIFERIAQYGFTPERYLVVVMAVWFGSMALLFTFRPQTQLKILLGSLIGLMIFASFGPWDMVSVSDRSQISRLEKILLANNMLKDGVAVPSTGKVTLSDRADIFSIIEYFQAEDRIEKIERYFPNLQNGHYDSASVDVAEKLNIPYITQYDRTAPEAEKQGEIISFYAKTESKAFPVKGYDKIYFDLMAVKGGGDVEGRPVRLEEDGLIYEQDGEFVVLATTEKLKEILEATRDRHDRGDINYVDDPIIVEGHSGSRRLRFLITSAHGTLYEDDSFLAQSIAGALLVRN